MAASPAMYTHVHDRTYNPLPPSLSSFFPLFMRGQFWRRPWLTDWLADSLLAVIARERKRIVRHQSIVVVVVVVCVYTDTIYCLQLSIRRSERKMGTLAATRDCWLLDIIRLKAFSSSSSSPSSPLSDCQAVFGDDRLTTLSTFLPLSLSLLSPDKLVEIDGFCGRTMYVRTYAFNLSICKRSSFLPSPSFRSLPQLPHKVTAKRKLSPKSRSLPFLLF